MLVQSSMGPVPRTERSFWILGCWSEYSDDRRGKTCKRSQDIYYGEKRVE